MGLTAWAVQAGVLCLGLAAAGRSEAEVATPQVVDVGALSQRFSDFQRRCAVDGQRLWGQSLCGPLLVVEPDTRVFVASQRPGTSGRAAVGTGPWLGVIPEGVDLADTALTWAGATWVQLRAPLPESPERLDALLIHEAFHRTRVSRGHEELGEGANAHLDSAEGRTLLQLEWRALASALQAQRPAERREAIEDALVFRAARQARFPTGAVEERALEREEGLAEDTGLAVSARDAEARRRLVLENLSTGALRRSFVRAFAEASGPAYGALLDDSSAANTWRAAVLADGDLGLLLARALRLPEAPVVVASAVAARAKRYNGDALREAEVDRERVTRARAERMRALLVEGPVLRLVLSGGDFLVNPGPHVALAEHGTVFPGARLVEDWGSLEATAEVLVSADGAFAVVAGPISDAEGSRLEGVGWVLELAPGWQLGPGEREGDFILEEVLAPVP
ncbi:hypothetical protein LZ198_21620 [Myxococcus sp. K15C18031901]|uniref:hypothetical protein n=1 Tax=Myxococcus dinghuensis TaxID=2906761 RepID=UPI0020A7962E|nr:hypothetical protein [Myxococcus dinghuensis]MCP3101478.1 hypothetical protein [Myxococcus dinghuensis]